MIPRTGEAKFSRAFQTMLNIAAVLVTYLALWGMTDAVLDPKGPAPAVYLPGALVLVLTLFLLRQPVKTGRKTLVLALVAAAGVLTVARIPALMAGGKVLMNRIFERSAQEQAYWYEMFPVSGSEYEQGKQLGWALAVLGVWSGAGIGLLWEKLPAALPVLLAAAVAVMTAFFGIAVPVWVLIAAAAGILLQALPRKKEYALRPLLLGLLLLALIAAFLILVRPGERAGIARRAEQMRDSMAYQTAAYPEEETIQEIVPQPQVQTEESEFQEEESPQNEDLPDRDWKTTLRKALLILLVALVLFLPSIMKDILRRRQKKNREGIDDEDPAASIRALFPYTIRWLQQLGLPSDNRTYREYAEEVTAISPAGGAMYSEMVDLWQESYFSRHAMSGEKREKMKRFSDAVREEILNKMNWKQRIRVKYIEAL